MTKKENVSQKFLEIKRLKRALKPNTAMEYLKKRKRLRDLKTPLLFKSYIKVMEHYLSQTVKINYGKKREK